jgi:hypothetical protein
MVRCDTADARENDARFADIRRFPTHAFVVLTLQKLVHLYDSDCEDSDSDADAQSRRSGLSRRSARSSRRLLRRLRSAFRSGAGDEQEKDLSSSKPTLSGDLGGYVRSLPTGFSDVPDISQLRTLQRYHASPNDPRAQYMEKNSALSHRNLAVACEQVSMFITNDNCIISFFEQSAQDIEGPIIRRLQTNDTIIRQ